MLARPVSALLFASLGLASLAPTVATAQSADTVVAAPDFATETYGDAWDYEQATDVLLDVGPALNLTGARVADGELAFTVAQTGHASLVFGGWLGALYTGRESPLAPIDASRYTRAAIALTVDREVDAGLFWDRCYGSEPGCQAVAGAQGSIGWFIPAGTTTVFADLTQGNGLRWDGDMAALRLAVNPRLGPTNVRVDWVRLYEPTGARPLAVAGQQWSGPDGTSGVVAPEGFDTDAFPPGRYRFSGGESVTIAAPPVVVIDDPDALGGEDYATAALGDPWDFDQPTDVIAVNNIAGFQVGNGRVSGTNGPPNVNDPNLYLRVGPNGIDPNRYHRLTITQSYTGLFELADIAGGGTHGRWSWTRTGMHMVDVVQTKELVTYTTVPTYTVDLNTTPAAWLMEDDSPDRAGWNAGTVTNLRWDHNEDRGTRAWTVDDVTLRADDEARGSFDVNFHTVDAADATVSLYADRDRAGFDGVRIASGLRASGGAGTFRWDTSSVEPGTWWLYAVGENGGATSRRYAEGPLVVVGGGTPATPVDPAQPSTSVPPDARISGSGRVETGVALSRTGFPSGAQRAVLALDQDFPDALAAAPLAAAVDGPLLLNTRDGLHPAVAEELRRLGVIEVFVMGGERAQSPQVMADLAAMGGIRAERLGGPSRYATAALAAERAVAWWRVHGALTPGREPILALGTSFADALAAGPLAAYARRPLLLVTRDDIPAETLATMATLGATHATVIGGQGAIPDATAARAGVPFDRISGANRYETGAAAAEAARRAGGDDRILLVASGAAFPDALAAGPAVVGLGGLLLLTDRDVLPDATDRFVDERRDRIQLLKVAGGRGAVSDPVVEALFTP